MAREIPVKGTRTHSEKAVLDTLTSLTKQISRGNYTRAKKLFELTVPAVYPKPISELAEAFGMMIVKVESREFRLEQVVENLERSYKELRAAQKKLGAFNRTLEKRVSNRTERLHEKNSELNKALKDLKRENKERKQADKNLQFLYQQIEVTNQKLQDAYLWMRHRKDQLEARKYQESIIFLTTDEGRIRGFTEKAVEVTSKSRAGLENGNIQDYFVPLEGQSFVDLIRRVKPRISALFTLRVKNRPEDSPVYEAKLTRIIVDGKRLLYMVLYPHVDK